MNTIGERIDFLRKLSDKSYNDLAKIVTEITSDGIYKAIKADRVKEYQINTLCEKLGWNKEWIMTGEGNYNDKPPKKEAANITEETDPLIDVLAGKLFKSKTFVANIADVVKEVLKETKKDYSPEEYRQVLEEALAQAEKLKKKK